MLFLQITNILILPPYPSLKSCETLFAHQRTLDKSNTFQSVSVSASFCVSAVLCKQLRAIILIFAPPLLPSTHILQPLNLLSVRLCSPPNISHTCNIVIHPSVSQMSAQVFQTSYTKPKCWPTWYSRELYTSSTWHICRVIHSLIIQHNSKAIISPPYLNS